MFEQVKSQAVQRGNILMFFTNRNRFRKYMLAILIGLPTWYVIGILVNLSNRFATELYGENHIDSGRSIMYAYAAIAIGDILIGFVSQWFQSRKKALYLFYSFAILSGIFFFGGGVKDDSTLYLACAMLGFSTGFWAIFVTMGAEQFGTNLRATAATTIPNMVRGSLPLMNLLFVSLFQNSWHLSLVQSAIWTGVIVMSITLVGAYFSEETFDKDLNYLEVEETLP
jgi:hypothetical protein